MCGIVGYLGRRNAVPVILEGLRRQEYGGDDSAGIVALENGIMRAVKAEGKLDRLGARPLSGVAVRCDADVDPPRNLAKSVTVE